MAKRYCGTHGAYDDEHSNGCPDCREAAERSENENKELLETLNEMSEHTEENARESRKAAERAAYLANNPGDYQCPECKMISLKYLASRCPKCQAGVSDSFWEGIQKKARVEAEKAAEERKLADEERQKWLASPEYALEQKNKKLASAAIARHSARIIRIDQISHRCGVFLHIVAAATPMLLLLKYTGIRQNIHWEGISVVVFVIIFGGIGWVMPGLWGYEIGKGVTSFILRIFWKESKIA